MSPQKPPMHKPRGAVNSHHDYNRRRLQRFYNSTDWKRAREAKKDQDPLCEPCRDAVRIEPAEQVHHLVPIKTPEGWLKRFDLID